MLDFCFLATCENLIFLPFTICLNSSSFKLDREKEKFLGTNDAEPLGVYVILKKSVCLLVYFITFTMNSFTSIALNTLNFQQKFNCTFNRENFLPMAVQTPKSGNRTTISDESQCSVKPKYLESKKQ